MDRKYEDELGFSIPGIQSVTEDMTVENTSNRSIKEEFVSHIQNELAPVWTSAGGDAQINELVNFANNEYQNYIDYLNERIQGLEDMIPSLNEINNA